MKAAFGAMFEGDENVSNVFGDSISEIRFESEISENPKKAMGE